LNFSQEEKDLQDLKSKLKSFYIRLTKSLLKILNSLKRKIIIKKKFIFFTAGIYKTKKIC
jgi:hypothetical protein